MADIGVETAAQYRRRGFAKAPVLSLVADFTERGGEAVYSCGGANTASINTAKSAGFVPYARSVALAG